MKYVGSRLNPEEGTVSDVSVMVEPDVGPRRVLQNLAPDVSPTGFAWGYAGAGSHALARSILLDHFGSAEEQRALVLTHAFVAAHVSTWGPSWEISGDELREWIESTGD